MLVCGRLRECLCVAGCGNVCVWQAVGMFVYDRLRECLCGRLRDCLCVAG